MFKITVDDAKKYKNAIDAIVNLIAEGVLEVREEGLYLKAMDPSQIAMVVFEMPKTAFSHYEAPPVSAKIGLDFDAISKILSRARQDEKLQMDLEGNKFQLKFIGHGRRRSFRVPVLDMPVGLIKEPGVPHDAVVKLSSSHFKESLRDASLIGSHVTLEANAEGFKIDVKGDTSDLTEENEKNGGQIMEINISQPARATFLLQYLEDMIKACPDNSFFYLHLKTDKPLKIEYEVEKAKVTYYLAPRVDSD